jgi:diguanylate cyclase
LAYLAPPVSELLGVKLDGRDSVMDDPVPVTRRLAGIGYGVALVALGLQGVVSLPTVHAGFASAEVTGLWMQVTVDSAAALLILLRAWVDRRERGAWTWLGVGVLAFAAGDAYWTVVVRELDPEPYVSLADVGWLTLYPCFFIGLSWLLRVRLPRLGAAAWFDGLIAAACAAAFASIPFLATIEGADGGSAWEVAANLAYPVCDIVLTGGLFGCWALTGFRTDRTWVLLLAGMALFTVGDAVGMLELLGDESVTGAWLNLTWSVGLIAIAGAARPSRRGPDARPRPMWISVGLPAVLACACVALLLDGAWLHHGLPAVSSGLAAVAVTASVLRLLLTLRTVEALAEARHEARTDDLTDLPNRRLFLERLNRELRGRDDGAPLAVALVDLDRFKDVNDSFGHHVGDELLRLVAARLLDPVGPSGTLARMGGDEFGVILPAADLNEARERAAAMLESLRDPFELDGTALHVDASIGLATFPHDGADTSALMRHADTEMYMAKSSHSGFSVRSRRPDDDTTRRRLDTLEQLRVGLDRGELILHYQPQVDIASRRVAGVEALVRWDHPHRGLLYPDAFLPIAEQAGLLGQITTQVLDIALRQCARWRVEGLELTVAVNITASSLQDVTFPDRVLEALDHYRVPPWALHLEVTEGVLMTDPERASTLLAGLRERGVRLAVDDYGTGYSGLNYLQTLPADDLKLDRSFVARCDTDPRSAAIVESTIHLAHRLGLRMIAEGVETESVLDRLEQYECDVAQGYLLGRPQNPESLSHWLHRHHLSNV